MTTMTPPRSVSNRTLLTILTGAHLVNDFYGLVLPFLLPTLILAFKLNFAAAGLLALATDLLGGILQPVSGFIGDKFAKRKALMIYGFMAFIIGLILVGTSVSYGMILLAWLIYGFGTATFHPQSTNLITRIYIGAKGRAMGIHGIGGAIGNFSAPLIIALLVTWLGWRPTSLLLIVPGMVSIYFVGTMVSEPAKSLSDTPRAHIRPSLWLLSLTFGLIYMMYKSFLTFLPTFLVQHGSTLNQAGYISSSMLLVGFLAQPVGGYIYDRIGGRWLFALSALIAGSALLLFNGDSAIPRLIPIILLGAAVTATFPVSLAMASDLAGEDNVGMNVGLVFGLSGGLSALTPALTGIMADAIGLQMALQWLIVFPIAAFLTSLFLSSRSSPKNDSFID